ncbi:MAG: efflux RND transporter periplasmic adaptor subunit [Planctomycetota bacterium]
MKKIIALAILIAAAGGGWWYWHYRTDQAAAAAKAAEKKTEFVAAKKEPFKVVVGATGQVVANQEVQIKCKASGTITKLPVDVSDVVKKGDLLLGLDPIDESRLVQQAQVQLDQSKARLEEAKLNLTLAQQTLTTSTLRANANLASAKVQTETSKAKAARTAQLFEKKMESQEDLDNDTFAAAQAVANLAQAQAQVEDLKMLQTQIGLREQDVVIANQQVEADQLALDIQNQNLSYCSVTSPIDGVVDELDVQIGNIIASGVNNVSGGTTILMLSDLSHIYAMVSVDESDIGQVKLNQMVDITVDAYPDVVFSGVVTQIGVKGTVVSNVVTYNVKVEITSPNRTLLKPVMTTNVQIVVTDQPDALTVPASAVMHARRGYMVELKQPDGTTKHVPVKVGPSNGDDIQILGGLNEGDQISVNPSGLQSRWQKGAEQKGANQPHGPMMMGHPPH